MSIECPKCQTKNPPESTYCNNCATQLTSKDIPGAPTKTMTTSLKELTRGTVFAGRFEVIEELGEGGMGKVYRVEDKKINEEVALKLVRPEIAVDKKTIDRFRNELKYARRVAHRNVCKMYDLGEEDEIHYITMEYVPGENLRDMIRMMGRLSSGQAISVAKQVSEGLAEAHRLGVVHRDLKSGNIMIDRYGKARIMDFGIARSLKAKGVTGAEVMIGTPEYMSPEQVEGEEADERSDIYSLGVVMYEMLIGKVPFEGSSPLSIAMKHKTASPSDPRKANPGISGELSRVVLKCLEKEREDRYRSAEELHEELARIERGIPATERKIPERKPTTVREVIETFGKRWKMLVAALAVLVLAVAGFLLFRGVAPMASGADLTMLVVLPFENLGYPEDDYFADGLTEEITSRLSSLHGLGVISRTSAFQYKNSNKNTKEIGQELEVDYMLEGTVRWNRGTENGGRVRVTPQLIRVADDTHVWSERYDRVIEDIFSVQTEIAEQVAQQLDLAVIGPERDALEARPTENVEAYDYFLKAIEQENRGWSTSDEKYFNRSIELFDKAIELDPEFAQAYARKSMMHSRMYFFGLDRTEECLLKTRTAAERALELQPDLPDALAAMARYYYWGHLDYDRAIQIFQSILRARPNFDPALLGYIQRRQGLWDQALQTMEKSYQINPRGTQLIYELGGANIALRRYDQARIWLNKALSIDPDHLQAQLGKIGISVLSRGNLEEARSLMETLHQTPLADYMRFTLGMAERNYERVLDLLSSLSYDFYEEQNFYFLKDLAFATLHFTRQDSASAQMYAERARISLERSIGNQSEDPRFHAALGMAYAYLGQKEDAIREGNHAVDLYPVSEDAAMGPVYVLNLARIYTIVGELDSAVDLLEYLLSIPNAEYLWQVVSKPYLRLDPQWDLLRQHPGFLRLLQESPV